MGHLWSFTDIDECAGDSSLCGPNALCSNTNGGFSCACNVGYQKPPGVTITDAANPCQGTSHTNRFTQYAVFFESGCNDETLQGI